MFYSSLQLVFPTPLVLGHESSDTKVKVELWQTFHWVVYGRLGNGVNLVYSNQIPVGERSDLASIPRVFWWIPGFSPVGRNEKPAILHDYLYRNLFSNPALAGLRNHFHLDTKEQCRQFADDCLYYGMLACGENKFVAYTTYKAVRLFGTSRFNTP